MSHRLRARRCLFAFALCWTGAAACDAVPRLSAATVQAGPADVDVMTFNIRYASTQPPNAWPDRLPVLAEIIERWHPDVIGTQEGLYQQLIDIETKLPAYKWIGVGRDDGDNKGEFMAVFYRHDRLEPLAHENYWLSDTPDIPGSRTWGNTFPRMVTSVRFRDRVHGGEFLFVNTHLDHESQSSRERSATFILQRLQTTPPGLPIVLAGDFNSRAQENPVYDLFTRGGAFVDTWVAAGNADTLSTYHGFLGLVGAHQTGRIDWILLRGPIAPLSTEIVTDSRGSQYPSDHFPVIARVRLMPPTASTMLSPATGTSTRAGF